MPLVWQRTPTFAAWVAEQAMAMSGPSTRQEAPLAKDAHEAPCFYFMVNGACNPPQGSTCHQTHRPEDQGVLAKVPAADRRQAYKQRVGHLPPRQTPLSDNICRACECVQGNCMRGQKCRACTQSVTCAVPGDVNSPAPEGNSLHKTHSGRDVGAKTVPDAVSEPAEAKASTHAKQPSAADRHADAPKPTHNPRLTQPAERANYVAKAKANNTGKTQQQQPRPVMTREQVDLPFHQQPGSAQPFLLLFLLGSNHRHLTACACLLMPLYFHPGKRNVQEIPGRL